MTDHTLLLDSPAEDVTADFTARLQRSAGAPSAVLPAVKLAVHQDLRAIETRWRTFEKAADGTAFQTYEWLATWQQHVGKRHGVRPVVVTGTDSHDAMLFLLPLAIDRLGPARRLTWLGSDLCDYNAPLLAPDFARRVGAVSFAQLWQDVLKEISRHEGLRFDFVHFEKMPEVVGRQTNPLCGLAVAENPSHAYQARLGSDWDTFYAEKRSSNTR